MYPINITVTKKEFCLSLHYDGGNSYLFVNRKEIVKFKAKDSEIVASPICLGNISKDCLADNMKKSGLNRYVYEFRVDYTDINKTIDTAESMPFIHKYFMLKCDIK